jgi:hypothetical protein
MRSVPGALLACVSTLLVGCASDTSLTDDSAALTTAAYVTVVTVFVPPTTSGAPTTTIDPFEQVVDECIEYIPIGAFSGYQKAIDLWLFIGQDRSLLRDVCTQIQKDDPVTLAVFSEMLAASKAATGPTGSTTSTSVSTTTVSTNSATTSTGG